MSNKDIPSSNLIQNNAAIAQQGQFLSQFYSKASSAPKTPLNVQGSSLAYAQQMLPE